MAQDRRKSSILAQDVKMQAKIFMALEFLEEKGPMLS